MRPKYRVTLRYVALVVTINLIFQIYDHFVR